MAVKTVCDICGMDSDDFQYVLPYHATYYTERKGVKLAMHQHLQPCRLNLCGKCEENIASFLDALKENMK